MQNLSEGKQLRYILDAANNKWWFSVIDICALLCGSDYQKARNYWKWLKRKLCKEGSQLVSETIQMKMPALDGKSRYTDVMDANDIMKLIEAIPSKKAGPFKGWLKYITADALENQLAEAAAKAAGKTKQEIETSKPRVGYMRIIRIAKVFYFRDNGMIDIWEAGAAALPMQEAA
jgi:hypothetical protein